MTEPSRSTVQYRPSGMGTFQSSRWRPTYRAVVPKYAAMALAVRSRPMPVVSISIPKVWFFMGCAPFAWSFRFPAGLFARPARRDTFITPRRRKSNPTEATRIRAQNSSDLTRAAPGKKALPSPRAPEAPAALPDTAPCPRRPGETPPAPRPPRHTAASAPPPA